MRKSILLLLLFAIMLCSTAFATITITDINLTCSPTNPANSNCYTDSTITIRYKMTDSNVLPPSGDVTSLADGNQSHWKMFVNYGTAGECKSTGSITPVQDSNIRASGVCSTDIYGNDNNFNLGRNCVMVINPIKTLKSGSYCFDLNVATYTAGTAAAGKYNADKNANVTMTVDNALVSTTTQNVLNLVPLALVAVAIVIIAGALIAIKAGANILPYLPALIAMLIALIVIGVFLTLLAGTA